MLTTVFLALTWAAPAAPEPAKKDDPPAKKDLFSKEKWYKDQKGKEQVFEGVLRYKPLPKDTAIIGRHNAFTLEMTVAGKKDVREVYVGGKPELLKPYADKRVKITGKAVEMEVVGKVHREVWPASVELVKPA